MKNFHKLRGFIVYQFLASLIIVLICTLISSAVSYRVLRGEMSKWLIDNNNKVLEQYSETIDTLIASNSNEVYRQILNDISIVESMKYYLYFPLKDNIMDTLKINKYLSSIKESNQLIQSVGIFYADNNLLISSDKIRYDLFYEYRRKELQLYSDVLNTSSERKNSFLSLADQSTLCMMRPIVSGGKTNALFVINYSLSALRERLRNTLPSEFGNFFVVDSDNTVLFDIDGVSAAENLLDNSVYAQVFSEPFGIDTYNVEIEREPSIISYRNDGEENWKYISIAPTNIYMKPISYILKNLLISVLITILAGLILAVVILLWQSRPMRSIVSLCNLANANTNVNISKTSDTFGIISRTLTGLMSTIETHNQEISRIMPVLRDNFILWLLSEMPVDAGEIQDNMLLMQINFPYKNYCVLAVKAEIISKDSDDYIDDFRQEYALAEVKLRFENIFNNDDALCHFYKKDSLILGFVNFNYNEEHLKTICEELTRNSIYGYNIYSCSGGVVQNINEIADAAKYAISGLKYSYIYPEKKYFTRAEIRNFNKTSLIGIQPILKGFISWLKLEDYDRCLHELDNFVERVRTDGCRIDDLNSLIYSIALEIESEGSVDAKFRRDFMEIYSQNIDILSLRNVLCERICSLKLISNKFADNTTDKLVFNAKQYIKENLTNAQLSLQSVAEALGVSATYLSRIFSEREGMTFVDFVTHAKMEYGRSLLLETELTLNEISSELNYASAQYFISRFKKYFDTTPSVYRKIHTKR